jgi:hypothetical protein
MPTYNAPTRARIGVAVASVAVAIGACGSSGSKPRASTGRYGPANSPATLSRCMRANGVSGFPDPVAAPGGGVGLPLFITGDRSLTADGKAFAGPVLRSAERACKAYLPPAGGPLLQVRAQQLRQELTLARCMRAHAVPNFPDPTSSGGAQAGPQAGIDPQSPAFRSAARVCGAGDGGNVEIGG